MAVTPRARRFTVEEYERMVDAGVFPPEARVELIEGEIIDMAPLGNPHASVVDRLNMLLSSRTPTSTASRRPPPRRSCS